MRDVGDRLGLLPVSDISQTSMDEVALNYVFGDIDHKFGALGVPDVEDFCNLDEVFSMGLDADVCSFVRFGLFCHTICVGWHQLVFA